MQKAKSSHFSHKGTSYALEMPLPFALRKKKTRSGDRKRFRNTELLLMQQSDQNILKMLFFFRNTWRCIKLYKFPFSSEFFRFSRKFLHDFPCEMEAAKRLRHDWVERSDWWGCARLIIHKHRRRKWRTRREGTGIHESHMSPKHELTS